MTTTCNIAVDDVLHKITADTPLYCQREYKLAAENVKLLCQNIYVQGLTESLR